MVANSCMDMGDSIRVSQMEFESSALDLRDVNRIVLLAILTQEFTGTFGGEWLVQNHGPVGQLAG
ncbi:hypothetical protein N7516_004550 [Penicillium verrucosum]|uniref:uncharacterized protein n=1 Tax=Penicillium verrucosum TaxID=60171 RepID=UPI002545A156|nr:uncharacterized protein N7516_004550 [Penicillium verrucosum]KAJ5944382.1 hypothetical protein N7516_004550 [Penicillium verrucosum]